MNWLRVFVSPASRLALFLGRAVPSIVNGFVVATISFTLGALILRVHVRLAEVGSLSLTLLASCFACATLGLCIGALGLRGRNITLFADSISGALLLVSGANVPFERLPGWLRTIASYVPLTHGIHAAARSPGAPRSGRSAD